MDSEENTMNAYKWVIWSVLGAAPLSVHAIDLGNVVEGAAESAAKRAATSAAKEAVDSVFEDENGDKNKGAQQTKKTKDTKKAKAKQGKGKKHD